MPNETEPLRPEPEGMGREKEALQKAEAGGCHFARLSPLQGECRCLCSRLCTCCRGMESKALEYAGLWFLLSLVQFSTPCPLCSGPGPHMLGLVGPLQAV